jgi:hypothetical protein
MAVEQHRHDEDGNVVLIEDDTPSPEEIAARAAERAAEAQAAAEVEVARVQADAAVQLAKIERSALDDEERIELEALREEVAALKAMNAPPEPDPVIVEAPDSGPADDEPEDAPPPAEGSPEPSPGRKRVGLGMW